MAEAAHEYRLTPAQWRRCSPADRAEMVAVRRLRNLMQAVEYAEMKERTASRR